MRRIAGESTVERDAKEVCGRENDPDPLPQPPPLANHGRTIRWLTCGGEMVVTSRGCQSPADALAAAYAEAVAQGYRPPRFWQLRRRLYEANYQRMLWAANTAGSRQASPPGRGKGVAGALQN